MTEATGSRASVNCPACGGGGASAFLSLHDDRYGYDGTTRLAICGTCRHKFADPPLGTDVLKTLYTRYYQREAIDPSKLTIYEAPGSLRTWLNGDRSSAARWVPPQVRVLDIGCGLGAYVGYHAQRGCDAHGIDADANVGIVAEKFGLNVRVGLFDSRDYQPEYFDFVTMDQVIEHVSDPLASLADVRRVLKHDGRLVLSTPNADGWGAGLFGRKWLNWHVPYHQQFISRQSMRQLAARSGFVVESMATVTRSAWLLYQCAHLLTYPEPGAASVFWAPTRRKPRPGQYLMLKLVMAARLTLVPQLLTRLLDALGRGDNVVVILRKAHDAGMPGDAA